MGEEPGQDEALLRYVEDGLRHAPSPRAAPGDWLTWDSIQGAWRAHPAWSLVTELQLSHELLHRHMREGVRRIHALLDSGLLDKLVTLNLARCDLDEELLAAWNEHTPLPHLTTLDLSDNALDGSDALVTLLLRHASTLRVLHLAGFMGCSALGLMRLTKQGALDHITHLDLSRTALTSEHVSVLCNAQLPRLRVLRLHQVEIMPEERSRLTSSWLGPLIA